MPETAVQRSRNVLVAIRHTPDRLLHPIRYRSAVRRLERATLPTEILFICHGNICRSAYAARALGERLPPEAHGLVTAHSAGFVGPGRPSPPEAVQVARSRNVDLSGHCSRTVTPEIARHSSLVVTMDTRQRRAMATYGVARDAILILGDLDPLRIRKRGIMDPYERPIEVFESVFDRLDRCLRQLIGTLVRGTSSPQPGGAGEANAPSHPP